MSENATLSLYTVTASPSVRVTKKKKSFSLNSSLQLASSLSRRQVRLDLIVRHISNVTGFRVRQPSADIHQYMELIKKTIVQLEFHKLYLNTPVVC